MVGAYNLEPVPTATPTAVPTATPNPDYGGWYYNPQPGGQDRTQTEALRKAAAVFDIALTDHVIIGRKKYFSFCDGAESRY